MLALCLALVINFAGLNAQTNSEYTFRQQVVADGAGFNSNGDPAPALSMACLAANGYGQWTLSTTAGSGSSTTGLGSVMFPAGWYLLANGLYQPSLNYASTDVTHHPCCIPPGVVQAGALAVGTESTLIDTSTSSCTALHSEAYVYQSNRMWQMLYDTAKLYIEHCATDLDAPRLFSWMGEAVNGLTGNRDPLRSEYLTWLEHALYFDTVHIEYFCQCVQAIAGELPIPVGTDTSPTGWMVLENRQLAVLGWLVVNVNCDSPYVWQTYMKMRNWMLQNWLGYDPSWRLAHPLDTTLPSMADLGLDTLLAKHFKYAHVEGKPFPSIVPEYALSRNPFDGTTALRFTLSEASYERVDVLDVLGREVWSEGDGHLLDPGEHTIPIDMSTAPSGTYYLRITLGTGEVRTIKMVKEGAGH